MRILLTGGSGDLGSLLSLSIKDHNDVPVVIDMLEPKVLDIEFFQASILDRNILKHAMKDIDCVIHIAAWHGIHENNKTTEEFHDLNVTGSFNVFEAAAKEGVKNFIFISSTSVDDKYGIYGHTKILSEEIAQVYSHRHGMNIIILRPRAFIPSWNRSVYNNFIDWAKWFSKGAVHIFDVKQSVMLAIDLLKSNQEIKRKVQTFIIDGAYDFTTEDLNNWDSNGAGETFKKYYSQFYDLAIDNGLDPTKKPKVIDINLTKKILNYCPEYSLGNMLEELDKFGSNGPLSPFEAIK